MENRPANGWTQYEAHVLAELRRLNEAMGETHGHINAVQFDVSALNGHVTDRIARLDERMTALTKAVNGHVSRFNEQHEEHRKKIDALNYKVYGALASLAAFVAFLFRGSLPI